MRNHEILARFQDIAKLQEYLYVNPEHHINVETTIGGTMVLRMDDEANVMAQFGQVSDSRLFNYNASLSVSVWLDIIDQLEEQPAQDFPGNFKNRWEEVKFIVATGRTVRSNRKAG